MSAMREIVILEGLIVVPRRDEALQRTLKRLRRLVDREGILSDVKSRRCFVSRTERRRRRQANRAHIGR